MKRSPLLFFGLLLFARSFAQMDFQKLLQEYVSRKPALDTMHGYPRGSFDSLKVTSKEGIAISFWWMPHEKKRGTALLVHGFMMNKSDMLSRSMVYYELGYNVIVMDLRARGQSGGTGTTSGPEIRSDVLAVMDYYKTHLDRYGPLVLVGYSHGGRAVVFAAEKDPANVKAVILESIPYSLAESFRRTYNMQPPPIPEGNIAAAFQAISNIPVLLMTGENDSAIVPDEALKISKSNNHPFSRSVTFKEAGHDLSITKYRNLYVEYIKSFLTSLQ